MHCACMPPQWLKPGLYEAATITFLRALVYALQTECRDCRAAADKMKRSKILFFLLPYQTAAGCWNDLLRADPRVVKLD